MTIRKLLTALALPAGLVFLLLILLAILSLKKARRLGGYLSLGIAVLFYLLSIEPVANMLMIPLEDYAPPIILEESQGEARYDLSGVGGIVILGGGTIPISPEEEGRGSLSPGALKRLIHGYRLAKATQAPVIVTGGVVLGSQDIEAEAVVAARMLRELGIEGERIVIEDAARTTMENALLVRDLVERAGGGRVILVTSAYHMPRSILSFTKAGLEAVPAPCDYKTDRSPHSIIDFLPSAESFNTSTTAIREYLGLIVYRISA